jgi:hypothetical protein
VRSLHNNTLELHVTVDKDRKQPNFEYQRCRKLLVSGPDATGLVTDTGDYTLPKILMPYKLTTEQSLREQKISPLDLRQSTYGALFELRPTTGLWRETS